MSELVRLLCVEFKYLHCAEPEYARDGKLTTSGQVELPDLHVGQSSCVAFGRYCARLQELGAGWSTHP